MYRICFILSISVLLIGKVKAQLPIISEVDLNSSQLYFNYTVNKGKTIYGLSKEYNSSQEELMGLNELNSSSSISMGQILKIPLRNNLIARKPNEDHSDLIPIMYVVKPKQTLYEISKKYLDLDVAFISKLNRLKNDQLFIGDTLLVGYMRNDPSRTLVQLKKPNVVPVMDFVPSSLALLDNIPSNSAMDVYVEKRPKFSKEHGIAFWETSDSENLEYLAMHPTAKLNSTIEIYNPMLNKKVLATVVGHLPHNTYSDDISIVISRPVARALGALDKKFYVEMTFLQ